MWSSRVPGSSVDRHMFFNNGAGGSDTRKNKMGLELSEPEDNVLARRYLEKRRVFVRGAFAM